MADNQSNSSNIDVAVQEQLVNAPSERSTSEHAEAASSWAKYDGLYGRGVHVM
jgi:hypothetical protein